MAQNFRLFPSGMVKLGSSVLRDLTPTVLGNQDDGFMSQLPNELRQCPNDVGEPAGLGKRDCLRSHIQYTHDRSNAHFPPKATR